MMVKLNVQNVKIRKNSCISKTEIKFNMENLCKDKEFIRELYC